MSSVLYKALLAFSLAVVLGIAGWVAWQGGFLAGVGLEGPGVAVGEVIAAGSGARDSSARKTIDIRVVESAGGTRPRLVVEIRNAGDSAIDRLYALASFRTGPRTVITSHPVVVAGETVGPLPSGASRRVLLRSTRRFHMDPLWYGGPFITADVVVSPDRAELGRRAAHGLTGIELEQ